MSIYSDHRVGALTDEEFEWLAAREKRQEQYWEAKDMEREYWHDDDDNEEIDEDK